MVKKHLKQLAAPKSWPVNRKSSTYVTRPAAGAHPFTNGISLSLALTNLLKIAKTTAEAKSLLYKKEVLVDGKRRKSPKFIVGFMDTISFPETKEAFRVMYNQKGTLIAQTIQPKEANLKLSRVIRKTVLGKDKTQLNIGAGRNIIVKKDEYKIGDSLLIELPTQKISKHLALEKGASVVLLSAKHIGQFGEITELQGNNVLVKTGEENFMTHKETVLVVGKGKPVINLPDQK